MKTVFLGIGTNKGNRERNISIAIKLLSEHKQIKIIKISRMLLNPPQEGIKTGHFLNGALKIKTSLTPLKLLSICKKIEKKLGRIQNRKQKIKKSRTIDLDILFYGKRIFRNKRITIPHPRLHKRYFVLIPMYELDKNFKHPVLNKTIGVLLKNLIKKSDKSKWGINKEVLGKLLIRNQHQKLS